LSDPDTHSLEQAALRLLGAREHTRRELRRKLNSRATDSGQLEQLLDALAARGAQSDRRYTQSYIASRRRRGFGPVRIRLELRERGVAAALVEESLDPDDARWDQVLVETAKAKFGGNPPQGFADWAKRARFLEYRGFSPDAIRRLITE